MKEKVKKSVKEPLCQNTKMATSVRAKSHWKLHVKSRKNFDIINHIPM